ncbi:hypothetical protein EW026_g6389 [Hermanssonia centrifuga]|uniref:Uncharacterized protein n=1 Tax=Hermanssonia centrifuga TaxID=98765 RepID=A0A4S4KFI6_9APHY|nr:hypothetical protein EW026_g6389 [Hermanssonia centrifuga]
MSYPRHDPSTPSVNANINSDDFPTEWGTFADMTALVLSLPPGSLAATFDISAAYRITPVRPEQQNALCVLWRGQIYVDRAVAFGLRSSAGVFSLIADMLAAIYRAYNIGPLRKWVDDFIVIRLPGHSWTEAEFVALTANFGVPWAPTKTRPLASRQQYIGFIWDLANKRVCLPEEKFANIKSLVRKWLTPETRFSARDAARLHGKLVHVSSIFPLIRPFLPTISHFAGHFVSPRAALHVPGAVAADLSWIRFLLSALPNELPLETPDPLDLDWWGDASTSFGVGVTVGSFWAVWKWADSLQIGPHREFDIGWAEAVAVELGLRMAIYHNLLTDRQPSQANILVRSDNAGVVAVVNKGRSRTCTPDRKLCPVPPECFRRTVPRGHQSLPCWFSHCHNPLADALASTPGGQNDIVVMSAHIAEEQLPTTDAPSHRPPTTTRRMDPERLQLLPSPLRPECRADERIFQWRGVNRPPPSTLDIPVIQRLAQMASNSSLRDTGSYGSGLRKFHIFCDVFSVTEGDRLPASFPLLHSFTLWAAADPEPGDTALTDSAPFEPVAVVTVRKYLAAIRAWHLAQGWPPPLSIEDLTRLNWSLRGLDNLQAQRRTRPPRPPITIAMLIALKRTLDLKSPFDACIWAMAACAFWGMMRFGEVSVKSRQVFHTMRHLARRHLVYGTDLNGRSYARLDLPAAKTAKPGETQSVFLVEQGELSAIAALQNLCKVVPANESDPLFSWLDHAGTVRPMVKARALSRINTVLIAWGWGTSFGHSFRIGGASFYLSQKVSPEIVRVAGRWKSLAYETYIRAFEHVASQHMADLADRYITEPLVG